jgi:hypothetical protein
MVYHAPWRRGRGRTAGGACAPTEPGVDARTLHLQMEPRAGTRLSSLITEPATGSSVLAGRLVSRTYHPGLELPVVIIRESNTADESEA